MLDRLYRYGAYPNSHDLLKFAATIFMVIDHTGLFFYEGDLSFRVLGRIAAPLFFFLVGYVKPKRFVWPLVIYGIIITGLTYASNHQIYINILLNFVIIKLFLCEVEPKKLDKTDLILLMNLLIIFNPFCFIYLEYGTSGLFFAVAARLLAEDNKRGRTWLVVAIVHHFIYESLGFNFIAYPAYQAAIIAIALTLLLIMWQYQQRTWRLPKALGFPILLISRYSLQVYFWHVVLLKTYTFAPFKNALLKITSFL